MENIRQAVERARAQQAGVKPVSLPAATRHKESPPITPSFELDDVELDVRSLTLSRVVSFNGADQRSRTYDILRTQVLQSMTPKGWKVVGVTSPTPGCGKTVTAANLAFSIARQPEQSVVLVDLDLRKPGLSKCLSLRPLTGGIKDLLREKATLREVAQGIRAGNQRIVVLPTAASNESAELTVSAAMRDLMGRLRKEFQTIIIDLPPVLTSDDVISVLPQIDCLILVAAIGHSKRYEVEECVRHLGGTGRLVRLVVNKSVEKEAIYY